MDTISAALEPAIAALQNFTSATLRRWAIVLMLPAGVYLAQLIVRDYSRWRSLGPGGLPYNFYGYLKQSLLRPLTFSNLYSSSPYQSMKTSNALESRRFLPDLPVRRGPRPVIPNYAGPSRQITYPASQKLVGASTEIIQQVASDNVGITLYRDSVMERGGPALFVEPKVCENAPLHLHTSGQAEREFFHLHESEGSYHCFLSAADAEQLLAKGWGQRHPLSGRCIGGKSLSAAYVTVYAPLAEEHLEIVRVAAKAALAYACDGNIWIQ